MFESTVERVEGYFKKITESGKYLYYKINTYFRDCVFDMYIYYPEETQKEGELRYRITLYNEPSEGEKLSIAISAHDEDEGEHDEAYFRMETIPIEDFIEFLKDHSKELRDIDFKERNRMRQIRNKKKVKQS